MTFGRTLKRLNWNQCQLKILEDKTFSDFVSISWRYFFYGKKDQIVDLPTNVHSVFWSCTLYRFTLGWKVGGSDERGRGIERLFLRRPWKKKKIPENLALGWLAKWIFLDKMDYFSIKKNAIYNLQIGFKNLSKFTESSLWLKTLYLYL